jgi:hypothetical protein
MRQVVGDPVAIHVRRDAELPRLLHQHGLFQEFIRENDFFLFELRCARCRLGPVQLEILEVEG